MPNRFTMPVSITGRLAILNERHRLPEIFERMRSPGVITLTEYLDVVTVGPEARRLVTETIASQFRLPTDELADNADLVDVRVTIEPYGDVFTCAAFEFILPPDAPETAA